jgi:hypothetical protein
LFLYYKLLFEYKECSSFKEATHIYIDSKNKLSVDNNDAIIELESSKIKVSIKKLLNDLSIIEKPIKLLKQLQGKKINTGRKRCVKQFTYRDLKFKIIDKLYILPQVPIISRQLNTTSMISNCGINDDAIIELRRSLFGKNDIVKVLPTFWSQFKRMYITNMAILRQLLLPLL